MNFNEWKKKEIERLKNVLIGLEKDIFNCREDYQYNFNNGDMVSCNMLREELHHLCETKSNIKLEINHLKRMY